VAEAPPPDLLATDVLRELQSLDEDGSLLTGLISTFRDDTTSKLLVLREALATGDDAELGRVAHSLCGAARTLGATGVARAAKELQEAARAGVADKAVLLSELSRQVVLGLDALARFVEP
jgi:HPt (histidine-containing phosphotransfer) domain-containing protein